jgi:hypothetical protein
MRDWIRTLAAASIAPWTDRRAAERWASNCSIVIPVVIPVVPPIVASASPGVGGASIATGRPSS